MDRELPNNELIASAEIPPSRIEQLPPEEREVYERYMQTISPLYRKLVRADIATGDSKLRKLYNAYRTQETTTLSHEDHILEIPVYRMGGISFSEKMQHPETNKPLPPEVQRNIRNALLFVLGEFFPAIDIAQRNAEKDYAFIEAGDQQDYTAENMVVLMQSIFPRVIAEQIAYAEPHVTKGQVSQRIHELEETIKAHEYLYISVGSIKKNGRVIVYPVPTADGDMTFRLGQQLQSDKDLITAVLASRSIHDERMHRKLENLEDSGEEFSGVLLSNPAKEWNRGFTTYPVTEKIEKKKATLEYAAVMKDKYQRELQPGTDPVEGWPITDDNMRYFARVSAGNQLSAEEQYNNTLISTEQAKNLLYNKTTTIPLEAEVVRVRLGENVIDGDLSGLTKFAQHLEALTNQARQKLNEKKIAYLVDLSEEDLQEQIQRPDVFPIYKEYQQDVMLLRSMDAIWEGWQLILERWQLKMTKILQDVAIASDNRDGDGAIFITKDLLPEDLIQRAMTFAASFRETVKEMRQMFTVQDHGVWLALQFVQTLYLDEGQHNMKVAVSGSGATLQVYPGHSYKVTETVFGQDEQDIARADEVKRVYEYAEPLEFEAVVAISEKQYYAFKGMDKQGKRINSQEDPIEPQLLQKGYVLVSGEAFYKTRVLDRSTMEEETLPIPLRGYFCIKPSVTSPYYDLIRQAQIAQTGAYIV